MKRRIRGVMAAVLAFVMCLGYVPAQTVEVQAAENLIVNGNFDDPDNLEVWNGGGHNGGATVTAEVSDTPIGPNKIMTYGKITNRTSNYNAFAYDVAGLVEEGVMYNFSFWIMLDAQDYKDAPEAQRTVEISPHIKVNGKDDYSQGVNGTVRQVLEPGVWTQLTGTFSSSWSDGLEVLALRFLEQGENWGSGPGVQGTYYLTGVELYVPDKSPELIQKGIVDLKNVVNKKLGEDGDFIVGAAITADDLGDIEAMGLVKKHFNAVTIGNELKPDAMFGYAAANPKTETVIFNGEELLVPVLDYSRADTVLNYIVRWNIENPDDMIKVRGHVLLWHEQTPEWFFHEDYDLAKPLVTAEQMSKRLEWYIASMAAHFNVPGSKYDGLFYAWDVVNEAVSDGTGTYRSDKENSMWWKVYQSNEFIIQAFRFANKYMPEDIDLYYNDYGDIGVRKSQGIAQLLRDVKEAEGTRIDGMGMQAHYTLMNELVSDFENAVRLYAGIVDQVQITEWDFAASPNYIPNEIGTQEEYIRQAKTYHSFYEAIQKLREEGINFSGFTFWGIIDKNSWLQDRYALEQIPLLFDNGYQVKPAFWAFADEARFQKLVNPTPTPAPATPTPEPTEAPAEVTNPSATPVPTDVPASETPASTEDGMDMTVVAVVAVLLLCGAGAVIMKRKRG